MVREPAPSPVATVLERVAAETGRPVRDLAPLYESIQPEALESLVAHGFEGELTFRYEGCTVTVTGDGSVRVS